MLRQRRIGNITPINKRGLIKLIEKSPARTPTNRSFILIPRNPSFQKDGKEKNPTVSTPKVVPQDNQTTHAISRPTSKERVFIGKIISLKKEKNEICSAFQKCESTLKHNIKKLSKENQSLKAVIRKLIPFLDRKSVV